MDDTLLKPYMYTMYEILRPGKYDFYDKRKGEKLKVHIYTVPGYILVIALFRETKFSGANGHREK